MGIGVSATRQFSKWPGIAQRYEDICYKPAFCMYLYDGEKLGGPWPAKGINAIPTPVSRPKLINMLYDVVTSLGITVTFGERVAEYFEAPDTAQAGVLTSAGKRHQADLVVAADGVGSPSSKLILKNDSRPKSSGFAVYRTAFPTSVAHSNDEVARDFPLLESGDDDVRMYLGPNTHAITVVSKDVTTWLLTHKVRRRSGVWMTRDRVVDPPFPPRTGAVLPNPGRARSTPKT